MNEDGVKTKVVVATERTETVRFSLAFLKRTLGLSKDAQILVEIDDSDDVFPGTVCRAMTGDLISVTTTHKREEA